MTSYRLAALHLFSTVHYGNVQGDAGIERLANINERESPHETPRVCRWQEFQDWERFWMRKIKGLRWYMIGLVTIGTVLGYLTRNAMAVAAPTLEGTLHITTQQYSYIVAAYSACYTVMQPVAGYILDVLGTKISYAMFAILWALFCMGTALANSWGGLAIARGAVGMAEAAMIPAGLKATSEWFPAKERSIAVGYFNVGSSIGGMLAPPLVV
jgi:ACS family hexuronate transporter-like MFS transporter